MKRRGCWVYDVLSGLILALGFVSACMASAVVASAVREVLGL